jgi:hypothetical protein
MSEVAILRYNEGKPESKGISKQAVNYQKSANNMNGARRQWHSF